MRFEAENAEDDHRRIDGSQGVADWHQEHVPDAVVVRGVVRAESDERAEGQAEGVEDLGGRVQPDRRVEELVQLWRQKGYKKASRGLLYNLYI